MVDPRQRAWSNFDENEKMKSEKMKIDVSIRIHFCNFRKMKTTKNG
jgi:hypothetical protein